MARERNVHRPPRHISEKVPRRGGPNPTEAIRRALNLADDLIGEYQGWAIDDLEALWQRFRVATAKSKSMPRADIRKMFDMAHEIRGQGGSFGFPLVTVIADSLCKFLEARETLGAREIETVKIHILGMKSVFRQNLEGEQGTLVKDLQLLLAELRERVDEPR